MRKTTLGDRLRYMFDNYMARGEAFMAAVEGLRR